MNYDLVDLGTGNLVGSYTSEIDALRDVAKSARLGGAEAVLTLALVTDEPPHGRLIADGRDLLALAENAAVAG